MPENGAPGLEAVLSRHGNFFDLRFWGDTLKPDNRSQKRKQQRELQGKRKRGTKEPRKRRKGRT